MKRIITLLAIVSMYNLAVSAQKKYEMVIEKTDGTEAVINVEDIVRTYFRERNSGGESAYTSCPDNNHPHWIDLGIGTLWRCCNEGASTPEEYGGYYTFDQAQAYNPPSKEQIQALVNNCSYTWTTQNGVTGGIFTGPNGSTIFLPAAGRVWGGQLENVGSCADCWSSTPSGGYLACGLALYSDKAYWAYYDYRDWGLSVRPVRQE